MRAKDFLKEFTIRLNKDNMFKGRSYWDIYRNDEPTFTELVNKNIIHNIIKDAGMTVQHEYFRIDTVGWISSYEDMKNDAKEKKISLNAHLWNLKIAVEHENSKSDWSDEVMKLIHIKCPLKVIIGYNHCDERGIKEQEKLDFLAKWMQSIDALKIGTKEEYLIILGNGCKKNPISNDYTEFGYVGYLYDFDDKQFHKI